MRHEPLDPDSLRAFLIDLLIAMALAIPVAVGLWVATVIVVLG